MQSPSNCTGVPAHRKPRAGKTSIPRITPKNQQPVPKPNLACNITLQLRPAGALPTIDAEKAIRRQVVQGLPKGRRPVIRNRIELFLPDNIGHISQSREFPARSVNSEEVTDADPSAYTEQGNTSTTASTISISEDVSDRDDFWWVLPATSPVTILGAGRVDPFGNYPIRITKTVQWLLDEGTAQISPYIRLPSHETVKITHLAVHTNPNPLFRTFQKAWLPSAIHDSAMFHQLLANIAINIYTIQGRDSTNVISMRHHSSALRDINSVIADPVKGIGDDVVRSVGTFVCHSVGVFSAMGEF